MSRDVKKTPPAKKVPGDDRRRGTGRERVFLSVGSNVGRRPGNMRRALEWLGREAGVEVVRVSLLYSTSPVGYTPQRKFLNGVVELRTRLAPRDLLDRLELIEERIGKSTPFRNGPRRIDIDVVLYGQRQIAGSRLTLPHPRMHGRRFVLEPLAEIAPGAVHPVLRRTAARLLAGLGQDERVRPWGEWLAGRWCRGGRV